LSVLVALVALPATAAVQFEFRQVTVSDSQLAKPTTVIGRAVVDGDRSRVDYLEGSSAGVGNYVISKASTRDLTLVNPEKKTFMTRHSQPVVDNQTLKFSVSGLKLDMKDMGEGPAIAGYPTHYYRLVAHYNVSLKVGSLDLEQAVETIVEKWTTDAFGDVALSFFSDDPAQSGDPDLDQLMEAEISKIPGLPLRQIVTVTARLNEQAIARNSQLKINPTRTQRTEMVVTKVGRITAAKGTFDVPIGFVDVSRQTAVEGKGSVHVLSMTDDSKPDGSN